MDAGESRLYDLKWIFSKWILRSLFSWILDSKAQYSGFHKKKFPGFRNPDYPTWASENCFVYKVFSRLHLIINLPRNDIPQKAFYGLQVSRLIYSVRFLLNINILKFTGKISVHSSKFGYSLYAAQHFKLE